MRIVAINPREDRAPRPVRRSLAQILYDTIEAIGGDGATEQEILDLLPAAITDAQDAKMLLTPKRLHNNLMTQSWAGYFIFNASEGRFRIAPKSYFEARRLAMKTPVGERRTPGFTKQKFVTPPMVEYRTDWWMCAACGAAGLAVGVLAGWAFL